MVKRFFSGNLYTWGDSYNYILGHNTRQPIYAPKKLELVYKDIQMTNLNSRLEPEYFGKSKEINFKFKSIGTGPFHAVCVTEQGQVYSFGDNRYEKLGHKAENILPNRVLGLMGQRIISTACGLDFSLALSANGKVFSWGYGGDHENWIYALMFREIPGALGHGNMRNYYVPSLIEELEDVVQIEAGYYHSLALTRSGVVYSWGNNEHSQLGYECPYSLAPGLMPLKNIKKISAARDYCAALDYLGEVFVWGKNHYGQLGLPDDVVKVPTKVDSQCLDIEAGEGALVLVHDDHVKIAGFQAYPQFQTVSFDRRPISFAVGDFYAAFVDSSGDVHSVGGLFDTKKRSFFSIKPPQLKFTKPPPGFFPGKVEFLTGKYSYHAAIIDN